MDKLMALLAGLLVGAGLTLSGMVNPMKVQNFMDLFGRWDPTLLFVMAAALAVTYAGYQLVLKAPRDAFQLVRHQRRIGGHDGNHRALLLATQLALQQMAPHRHAQHGEVLAPAEVRLHENAQRVALSGTLDDA